MRVITTQLFALFNKCLKRIDSIDRNLYSSKCCFGSDFSIRGEDWADFFPGRRKKNLKIVRTEEFGEGEDPFLSRYKMAIETWLRVIADMDRSLPGGRRDRCSARVEMVNCRRTGLVSPWQQRSLSSRALLHPSFNSATPVIRSNSKTATTQFSWEDTRPRRRCLLPRWGSAGK